MSLDRQLELAAQFGVPTFILVLAMLMLLPRFDRMIVLSERVDAELQVIISNCGYPTQRPLVIPEGP